LPIWGRKRKEAEEALSESKKLIIKVKKKGFDTSEAEKLYKKGKRAIKNKRFTDADVLIEEANTSAKRAYAKGIKERLSKRISELENKIKELESKKFETKSERKSLKIASKSLDKGVKSYKEGLKAVRLGLHDADVKFKKIVKVNELLFLINSQLREIENQNPEFPRLGDLRKRLKTLEETRDKGEFESALKPTTKLNAEVKSLNERHLGAYESISALKKKVKDVEVLQAKIDAAPKLKEAEDLLNQEKFDLAIKTANESVSEISSFLSQFRESKHHVDTASEKVNEVRSWGFSAFEAERDLDSAKKALDSNNFEEATKIAKEAIEKASTVRERHKRSLELIKSAKDEVAKIKKKGEDTMEYDVIIDEAEDEFNKGDYGASDEKINSMLKTLNNPS
jgi:chromosome segregation ATPase